MTTITKQSMYERWTSPDARPLFKGALIGEDGCRCAQGDVLHCAGVSDCELHIMEQSEADSATAELLGISTAHAVLLRIVNDSEDGQPERCLMAEDVPEYGVEILGPQAPQLFAMFRTIDTLSESQWDELTAEMNASFDAVDRVEATMYELSQVARRKVRYDIDVIGDAAAGAAPSWPPLTSISVQGVASALCARDLIGQYGFTQEDYDMLTGPWRRVVGKLHPNDADLRTTDQPIA